MRRWGNLFVNLCSPHWWRLRKLAPLFFFFSSLLDLCMTHGGVAVLTHLCVTPLWLQQTVHKRAALIWQPADLLFFYPTHPPHCTAAPTWLPVCVCICVCIHCPELHHSPVTVQNHTRCVFYLQTPACGWQVLSSKGRTRLDCCPGWGMVVVGGGGYTNTHVIQQEHFRCAVHWKEDHKAVSCSVAWPLFKALQVFKNNLIFVLFLKKNIWPSCRLIQDVMNTAGRGDVIFGSHLCPIPSSLRDQLSSLIISQILEIVPPVLLPSSFPLHSVLYFFLLSAFYTLIVSLLTHSHVSLALRFIWFNCATRCPN